MAERGAPFQPDGVTTHEWDGESIPTRGQFDLLIARYVTLQTGAERADLMHAYDLLVAARNPERADDSEPAVRVGTGVVVSMERYEQFRAWEREQEAGDRALLAGLTAPCTYCGNVYGLSEWAAHHSERHPSVTIPDFADRAAYYHSQSATRIRAAISRSLTAGQASPSVEQQTVCAHCGSRVYSIGNPCPQCGSIYTTRAAAPSSTPTGEPK